MKIEVCCGQCAKRFAAPERLAGRRVKCPCCGGAIEVPSPLVSLEPLDLDPTDPLAGFSAQDLTAGPALPGSGPKPRPSPQPAPVGRSDSPPGKPSPRTPATTNVGAGFAELVSKHKLFVAVVAVSVVGLLFSLGSGHVILAGMYLVVGGVIALIGFATAQRKRPVQESVGELAGWWGGSAALVLVIWQAFRSAGKAANGLETAVYLGAAMILVFLIVGLAFLIVLILDLVRGRGPFRSLACGYLIMFGALPLVVLASMPAGLGVDASATKTAKDLSAIPLPAFPDRGPMRPLQPGVEFAEVRLAVPVGQPGEGRLFVYLPSGAHEPHSLPCVLIAPAGSTLLHGMTLSDADQEEHTPYVKAGFAVVAYELDGPLDEERGGDPGKAFKKYAAALAGLVNARNALEYVLQKMPEVNPNRVYAAGHSSAGTVALVFAEHEPRIKGCVAYAPATDLVERNKEAAPLLSLVLPGSPGFLAEWSPRTHEANLQCPIFLFHARDDSNVPFSESAAFAERLKTAGKQVTFEAVDSGDHYDSMREEGIPAAIAWLQKE